MKTIGRDNYEEWCQEPPLTKDEWKQWHILRYKIYPDHDREFQTFLEAQVKTEQERYTQSYQIDGWLGPAKSSDAFVRLRRAQIKAYQEWQREEKI